MVGASAYAILNVVVSVVLVLVNKKVFAGTPLHLQNPGLARGRRAHFS